MSASSGASYKRTRNWIALGLAVGWLVLWYLHFDAQRVQQIADMQACKSGTGLRATACAGFDFMLPAEAASRLNVTIGMLMATLFAPLMFLPAMYLARRYVAFADGQEIRREAAAEAALRQRLQQESAARLAQSEADADAALRRISRGEVIHKLGAINDLTDLLRTGPDEERLMNIRHGVAQTLREITAKYTVAELAALIKSDELVEHTARAVVARLDTSPLSNVVEIQTLRVAIR